MQLNKHVYSIIVKKQQISLPFDGKIIRYLDMFVLEI